MAEEELSCSTDCRESEADSRNNIEGEDWDESNGNEAYDSSDGLLRCDRCDFEAPNSEVLQSHISSCSASDRNKLFECDICRMKFSNGANMRRHKMRHTGVKPYECKVCHKRFFRKDHLAEHCTIHAKTLPFHCPVCGRGFQRQIAMRAHFQNEHVGQGDSVKACPMCSYRAGSMKSLRLHFFNRHGIDLDRPSAGNNECAESPPLHFLAPQVEISMSDGGLSPGGEGNTDESQTSDCSPPSGITVKQEPPQSPHSAHDSAPSALASLIKVSPLKTLLSEERPAEMWSRRSQWINEMENSGRLTCLHCSIVFPDRTLYFLHKGCHSTADNPWKCNICGEQTSNVYDFNSHLLSKTHH